MNLIKKNFGLKLLALFLSIFLWLYVSYTQNPWNPTPSKAIVEIPLTLENLEPKMLVIESPKSIKLTVKGEADALANLKPNQIKAYVDLAHKLPGIYYPQVQTKTPLGITVIERNPANIQIRIDRLRTVMLPLKLHTLGELSPGFMLGKPVIEPPQVEVNGPENLINRIYQAEIMVNLNNLESNLLQRTVPTFLDDKGSNLLEDKQEQLNLTYAPRYVNVFLPIERRMLTRVFPLQPVITGKLAPGYELKEVTITPNLVTAAITKSTDRNLRLLQTEAVILEQNRSNVTRSVKIITPPGVSILGPGTAEVKLIVGKNKNFKP